MTNSRNFLAGGGEMGARMRSLDWSKSVLGPVESWPQSLLSSVSMLLPSKAQIILFWGAEFVVFYNDAYRSVFGAKHPQMLGMPGRIAWSEIWDGVLHPLLEGVVHTGEAFSAKDLLFVLERNGFVEETYFDVSYDPVRDESGAVGGAFCIVTETTGRVVGERRLALLKDLAARNATARSAREACVLAMETLAAKGRDVPFALAYLDDELQACTAGAETQLAQAGPEVVKELSIGRAGKLLIGINPQRPFDDQYVTFLDLVASQIATAIISASAYEDERKRAEALAEIDRAKTAFFSNVSHEFRTPLTLMLGPLEDGLDDAEAPLPPAQRERLELVRRNGLRLQKLVNTLLDFSRIEAGRAQASYAPTDLAELTADLASSFRSAIEKGGVRFSVDCAPLAEPAYVDRDMWEKIVLNLLSNAFKFTFEGEISVCLRQKGKLFELAVSDTGTGIPAAELPHVFERFRRVAGAKSRTHEGTGIGLALVHELARLHGGAIAAQSVEGKGSTFTVSIPAGKAHLAAERIGAARELAATTLGVEAFVEEALRWLPNAATLPSEKDFPTGAPAGRRARIVWADDNADMREYVRKLLSTRYDVEAVADGEAALTAVRARPPSLVLADVMMPRLDGFGLIGALRSDPATKAVPVMLLSARAGEDSRIEGMAAGADDYLVKPFSARELLVRVGTLLQSIDARREVLEQERRVAEANARLAAIVEFSDDAIVSKTLEGIVMSWNRGAEKLFGYPAAEAVGQHISLIIPADRISEEDYVIGKVRHGEVVDHFETLRRTKDGRSLHISLTVSPIRDAQGRVTGASKIARDITEQKRAEQALHEHRKQLVEADRLKDEFMAMLAHELRNPLAAIALGADLLKRAKLDDAKARFAAPAIERQAKQLQRLADDMLDIARATYGKLTLKKERVDLLKTAKAIAALHANGPGSVKIKVYGKPGWADGDPVRLQQMIGNLVDNAVKYGGRNIAIRVTSAGGRCGVSVEDDGQGIAPELLPNLFKPFVQGVRQLDRPQGGLGLGLALVERLAALHGGNVDVHSAGVGKGSTFTFSLPAAPGRAAGERRARPVSVLGKQRILVVEDEKDVREMLKFVLESEGHEVSIADSGVDGLAKFGSFRPDVALVDIGLPGMDGYEVARQARSLPGGKRIRLIAISGYGQDKDRQRARDAGFDQHLTKPVGYEQLAQAFKS